MGFLHKGTGFRLGMGYCKSPQECLKFQVQLSSINNKLGIKGHPNLPNGANGIVIDSKEVIAPLYDAVKTRTGAMASTNNL